MRLALYLVLSYLVVYAINVPVHHGFINPIVPAAVPWAVAAAVAVWCHWRGRSLIPAWLTLALIGGILVLGHLVPH